MSYSRFQTSQAGGQQYGDTSPFSIPWFQPSAIFVGESSQENDKLARKPTEDKHYSLFSLTTNHKEIRFYNIDTSSRIFSHVQPFYEPSVSDLDP